VLLAATGCSLLLAYWGVWKREHHHALSAQCSVCGRTDQQQELGAYRSACFGRAFQLIVYGPRFSFLIYSPSDLMLLLFFLVTGIVSER
jgi:hypothetical protein